jgi:uncharacterized damage-inducible protein DinB
MNLDVAPLPGYAEPYGLLAAILQDSTNEWRGELGGDLGPDITTWRARPGGPSMGAIIYHMIQSELFWFEIVALDQEIPADVKEELLWDQLDVDEGQWPDVPAKSLYWYFELQSRYRARALELAKRWPAPETMKVLHGSGRSMRWIFGHVIQHDSYHGGQIVMLHDLWKKNQS